MSIGPVSIPRLGLSAIVTVKSGPGIRAPERAITKDDKKIVARPVNICVVYLTVLKNTTRENCSNNEYATTKNKAVS